jgi:cell division protein FtsZ
MISYDRDPQQTIPESSVKIVGLGGAGANMLDRATLDGLTGVEMLSVNTDMRTLTSSVVSEKIQIGRNLTKGLGAGGDPEVGLKAAHESEQEIRDAFRNQKMVFLCVGLGGGTGSGAAPLICRLAREAGAFVVVFATMPFTFEGGRRQSQAETALNELAVLANALLTFDNNRMGELVLDKQGIHEAFAAADRMIAESVKAVTRLVMRPGLINVGLDDLMTALRTTRSRCLFGSGIAKGENRTQLALENALSSPLLDQGSLLTDAATVLVYICGGESMTLFEVELLMRGLAKHVPDSAHILFGAAVDASMGESLSVTLVSALPENKLTIGDDEEDEEASPEPDSELLPVKDVVSASSNEESSVSPAANDEEDEQVEVLDLLDDEMVEEESEDASDEEVSDEDANQEDDGEEIVEDVEEIEDESEDTSDEVDEFVLSPDADSGDDQASEEETLPPIVKSPLKNSQAELELDGGPKGKFEGENPNFLDGEDLDIPPFLRKKNR